MMKIEKKDNNQEPALFNLKAGVKMYVMMILIIIIIMSFSGDASAITAEEGQAAFDGIFWSLMSIWALGLSFGLAVKLINRS